MSKKILNTFLSFFVLPALGFLPSTRAESLFLQPELLQPQSETYSGSNISEDKEYLELKHRLDAMEAGK